MPGKDFARVLAKPMAQLNRSRHLLLIETPQQQNVFQQEGN
jgi:hypothetical protein